MALSHTSTNTLPLSMVGRGETVQLVEINSGQRLRKRLADLGLTIGMPVRVVQACPYGPVILAIRDDSRLALGRGITQKIIVSTVPTATEMGS